MKRRLLIAALLLFFLVINVTPGHAQTPTSMMTQIAVGCRNFLVAGASFTVTPTSRFSIQVTDVNKKTVYLRRGSMPPGRYGGYGGPFNPLPTQGPVVVVMMLDGATIANLTADYPSIAACGAFNTRADFLFTDGRLNVVDGAEPVAIYCYGDGTLSVLKPRSPNDSAAPEVIRLAQVQLARVPQHPVQNLLLESNSGVNLYELTSGELEIVAETREPGKQYTFIFGGC